MVTSPSASSLLASVFSGDNALMTILRDLSAPIASLPLSPYGCTVVEDK